MTNFLLESIMTNLISSIYSHKKIVCGTFHLNHINSSIFLKRRIWLASSKIKTRQSLWHSASSDAFHRRIEWTREILPKQVTMWCQYEWLFQFHVRNVLIWHSYLSSDVKTCLNFHIKSTQLSVKLFPRTKLWMLTNSSVTITTTTTNNSYDDNNIAKKKLTSALRVPRTNDFPLRSFCWYLFLAMAHHRMINSVA